MNNFQRAQIRYDNMLPDSYYDPPYYLCCACNDVEVDGEYDMCNDCLAAIDIGDEEGRA